MRKEERFVGVVKWFNNAKGFGFILREDPDSESSDSSNSNNEDGAHEDADVSDVSDSGNPDIVFSTTGLSPADNGDETNDPEDVFVHYSAIEGDGFRTLQQGERVEFNTERGPKGFHAVAVKRLS